MEAATLKKKSTGLSKGKLKKTIKNVLCRPDSINWPLVTEENAKDICTLLSKYKVDIPEYKKLKWEVLKAIPKHERPKPPAIKKPDSLLFGLRHCSEAVDRIECSALLVDSEVSPKSIVQPIIESCVIAKLPVICLEHLKELTLSNFGVKTACLGIKQGCLEQISKKIGELAKMCSPQQLKIQKEEVVIKTEPKDINMLDTTDNTEITNYLLKRTSKKTRVFVPPFNTVNKEIKKKFTGQDFIEFSGKPNKENTRDERNAEHTYKNMKLKRITNNPNRMQKGKKKEN